jgi:hypothetical protein
MLRAIEHDAEPRFEPELRQAKNIRRRRASWRTTLVVRVRLFASNGTFALSLILLKLAWNS